MAVTFRFDRVRAVFSSSAGASFVIHGFAPGTVIVAEYAKKLNMYEVGEDGEGARLQSRDRGGRVTLTLMQASASNADISAQVALDDLDGSGQGSLQILDLNGTTLVEGVGCWEEQANASFGGTFVPREWVFITDKLTISHGGITQ